METTLVGVIGCHVFDTIAFGKLVWECFYKYWNYLICVVTIFIFALEKHVYETFQPPLKSYISCLHIVEEYEMNLKSCMGVIEIIESIHVILSIDSVHTGNRARLNDMVLFCFNSIQYGFRLRSRLVGFGLIKAHRNIRSFFVFLYDT